ncbi:DUF2752 domain-containing protein [Bacteroides sp.]
MYLPHYKIIICGTIVIAAVVLLYFVNPIGAWYMPKCPFHLLTGLECPACGTQRAVHELLHLHIGKAFMYNPFFFLSAPYLLLLIVLQSLKGDKAQKIKSFLYGYRAINVYVLLIIVWWIARNLI